MGCTFSTKCPERIPPSCDAYRGTPLRLLGYGSHVGELCCAVLPHSLLHVPSMITTAYISSDVFSRAIEASNAGEGRQQIFVKTLDALIWHSLATILIPGLIVSKVKQMTLNATKMPTCPCSPPPALAKSLPMGVVRALPCIVGVLTLPLIMYPIDKAVSLLMDYTYRPALIKAEEKEPTKAPKKSSPNQKNAKI